MTRGRTNAGEDDDIVEAILAILLETRIEGGQRERLRALVATLARDPVGTTRLIDRLREPNFRDVALATLVQFIGVFRGEIEAEGEGSDAILALCGVVAGGGATATVLGSVNGVGAIVVVGLGAVALSGAAWWEAWSGRRKARRSAAALAALKERLEVQRDAWRDEAR